MGAAHLDPTAGEAEAEGTQKLVFPMASCSQTAVGNYSLIAFQHPSPRTKSVNLQSWVDGLNPDFPCGSLARGEDSLGLQYHRY